ncbi:MAG: radical SAM protein [Chloroflexota bacterium]
MNIVAVTGREDIAMLYIVEFGKDKLVECVEAVQPPTPREEKWVLLVSTLFGCPVRCLMCDAGGHYKGKLTSEEILAQIDYLVSTRYPDGVVPSKQFKIQFARMGEPTLNNDVLHVLKALPQRYQAPGLMSSLSTIAPRKTDFFFDQLVNIKDKYYSGGRFQFQFSLHTTDEKLRRQLVPIPTWSFAEMADYGKRFYQVGDRKITLNFALAEGTPVDPKILLRHFDPAKFLIKITPLNPTHQAQKHGLASHIDPMLSINKSQVVTSLQEAGYQVIVSIGEREENLIGSNCGQYVLRHLEAQTSLERGYTYPIRQLAQRGIPN